MSSVARINVATIVLSEVPSVLWPELAAILSATELSRAQRFRLERNWQQHVAAHALKRLMLSRTVGGAPQDWAFSVEPNGKPFVAGGKGPHFNLSHCDGLIACAVSQQVGVGIDVEPISRHAPLDIADRNFAAEECSWLFGLPEAERSLGFFKLWTLKEAILKATGAGMSQGMAGFVVAFDPLRVTFSHPTRNERASDWRLVQRAIGAEHLLALAWHGLEAEVSVEETRLDALARGRWTAC